jgi:transposase-like protein
VKTKLTLKTVRERCQDEASAYLFLEELRWDGDPYCPHCGHGKVYFLKPSNGTSRATGPKRTQSQRRVWKCAKCRKQFSVLTGTIFHGSKISLTVWLTVLCQVSSAKNGISAREVARMHDITPESAWHMLHRIREAMKREPLASLLVGHFVADEAYIGGDPKNRHASERKNPKPRGRGTDKVAVFSLLHRDSGEIHSQVIPTVDGRTIKDAILKVANPKGSILDTDSWSGYHRVAPEFDGHGVVNHSEGEYVGKRGETTNHVEGFFSQLKRSIDGTHHAVSEEHLPRYLAEFDFRYSTRKLDDSDRAMRIIDQSAGRRLTYHPLTGLG